MSKMAGVTTGKSPLHEKACVAGSAILGGAVGSIAPVVGTLSGAAVGAIIGVMICSRDVISKPIGNKLDFSSAIDEVGSNSNVQNKMINALIEKGLVKDQQSGAATLRYALAEAKRNPDKYYQSSAKSSSMPPTGKVAHGLDYISRKSQGAVASVVS